MTNWAILAPGNIARSFATALNGIDDAVCYAVAGRSAERSGKFAQEFGFCRVFENIQALLADPAVDIVYIASPHNAHHQQSLACLAAGKAVLCEKPMTVNVAQAKQVFAAAELADVFYMEAVWTRFLPVYQQIREWLDSGIIGEVSQVHASFGICRPFDQQHRLYNRELAGGSILDLGIYPITLADWVFGEAPVSIQGAGRIGLTGVDEQMAATVMYSDGRLAQISSSINIQTSHDAWIYGSKGRIHIAAPFWGSEAVSVTLNDRAAADSKVELPHAVNGYMFEIEEAQRCLAAACRQSDKLPWSTSLRVMTIMDELRTQLGVRYEFE